MGGGSPLALSVACCMLHRTGGCGAFPGEGELCSFFVLILRCARPTAPLRCRFCGWKLCGTMTNVVPWCLLPSCWRVSPSLTCWPWCGCSEDCGRPVQHGMIISGASLHRQERLLGRLPVIQVHYTNTKPEPPPLLPAPLATSNSPCSRPCPSALVCIRPAPHRSVQVCHSRSDVSTVFAVMRRHRSLHHQCNRLATCHRANPLRDPTCHLLGTSSPHA